ncbi:MAG: HAMP domain-containing protein [Bdellovibrionaceae bacterium]|nr:HAMP domain-containing protein [Pseudobdellovibrionaceae bacterium]
MMRIPISAKMIFFVVSFLVAATMIFAKQSSELFESVLVSREEYSNMVQAAAKASEVDRLVSSAVDRAQVIGALMVKHSLQKKADTGEVLLNFNRDKSLFAIDVYKVNGDQFEFVSRLTKKELLERDKLTVDFVDQLRKTQNFPMKDVIAKKIVIRNSSYPKGRPLVTLGLPLVRDDRDQVTYLALADLEFSYLQKPFSEESERVQFVFDQNGELLAHQDERRALARHSLASHPLFLKAKNDVIPRRQIQFVDPDFEAEMIGAYVQSPAYGLTVVAQTPKSVILEPARDMRRQAYYIAGVVISVAIFCLFLFSMTLTGPIETLADFVRHVSRGNFDVKVRSRMKFLFPDEVTDLANAFDQMTEGLKERDKVKMLFRKFQGTKIAEALLKNEVGGQGQNREATILMMDIRGFTSFCETHPPEQVVEMLNEYFEVMVGVISRNNGVVDKFIGDAILAVWGVPQSDDNDAQNAVKAALEMRSALKELNDWRLARGQEAIYVGMGLHSGPVVSGSIGSTERQEYTVIGDAVNIAARIESATKLFGQDLLISESVHQKVGSHFAVESAGQAEVKGKAEPLALFRVNGYLDGETGATVEVSTPYSEYAAATDEKAKIAS